MKTIIIAHNYNQNSFAAMSCELADWLCKQGNRVIFISHEPFFEIPKSTKIGNGELIICSWKTAKRPTNFENVLHFLRIYFKYKPQIVIGHFVGSNIAILVSKIMSVGLCKTFEYYHTLSGAIQCDQNQIFGSKNWRFYRKKLFYNIFCTQLICPSKMAEKDLKDYFGLKNATVILNPLQNRYLFDTSILTSDKIEILFLGRLAPTKGVLEMINAFLWYENKFPNTKLNLKIAGQGPLRDEVLKLIKTTTKISFLGSINYNFVDNAIKKSHFVIIPSMFDAFNMVGVEAMMNKVPILISTKTGLTAYLKDGHDCFIFEPSLDGIFNVFVRVESNFDQQNKMGESANKTFLKYFGMQSYCQQMSDLIL